MRVYPAIDLQGNQCVRLKQGDFAKKTVYANDPLMMAKTFEEKGSKYLHIVDLDAASNRSHDHSKIIATIKENTKLHIQVGGGIRDEVAIAKWLDLGIDAVVIGSLAVRNPAAVASLINNYGADKVIVALDVLAQDDAFYVADNAWQSSSGKRLDALINFYLQETATFCVLCTDISRDGMLQGPNIALYEKIKSDYPAVLIQASGGIRHSDDIKNLNERGIDGAIVGKALYENVSNLESLLGAVC